MSAAHTAGEWTRPGLSRLERVRAYRAEFGGEIDVAIAAVDEEVYRQEREGRLRLAAAAPDLLEAVIAADAVLKAHNFDPENSPRAELLAAIAKATGK